MKKQTLILGIAAMACILTSTHSSMAATSVRVVTVYRGDGTYFPLLKMSYNKNGLIKTMTQKASLDAHSIYASARKDTFSYRKNKITKVKSQGEKVITATPIYKSGKIVKLKFTTNKKTQTLKMTYKNNRIVKTSGISDYKANYVYNTKGLISKIKYADTTLAYSYDQKNYVSSISPIYINDKKDVVYLRNTYDASGLLKASYLKKFKYAKETISKTPVLEVEYKEIKVNRSIVSKVKKQQAWLLRNINDYSLYNI